MKYIITIEADIDPEEIIGLKEQIGELADIKVVNIEEREEEG